MDVSQATLHMFMYQYVVELHFVWGSRWQYQCRSYAEFQTLQVKAN